MIQIDKQYFRMKYIKFNFILLFLKEKTEKRERSRKKNYKRKKRNRRKQRKRIEKKRAQKGKILKKVWQKKNVMMMI